MKKAILLGLALILISGNSDAKMVLDKTKKFKDQKFKTIYTIQYNEITLEQARKIEKFMKKTFNDACEIDISLKKVYSSDTSLTFTDSGTVGPGSIY